MYTCNINYNQELIYFLFGLKIIFLLCDKYSFFNILTNYFIDFYSFCLVEHCLPRQWQSKTCWNWWWDQTQTLFREAYGSRSLLRPSWWWMEGNAKFTLLHAVNFVLGMRNSVFEFKFSHKYVKFVVDFVHLNFSTHGIWRLLWRINLNFNSHWRLCDMGIFILNWLKTKLFA